MNTETGYDGSLPEDDLSSELPPEWREEESVLKKVGAYVDGELPAKEREAVETELQTNPSGREAARVYRWLEEIVSKEETPPVSGEEWARVWDAIDRQKDQPVAERFTSSGQGGGTVEGGTVTDRAAKGEATSSPLGDRRKQDNILKPRMLSVFAAAAALLIVGLLTFLWIWREDPGVEITPRPDASPARIDSGTPDGLDTAPEVDGPNPDDNIAEGPEHLEGEKPRIENDVQHYDDF